jgi:protocatechuate 3,4-dioxygenase beta subunit
MTFKMRAAFRLFPASLLTMVTVAAQSPSLQQIPRDTKQTVTGTARLSGRVVAADTNRALARAIVRLATAGTDKPRWVWTDADGRWQFSRVPAGRYTLLISKTGYLSLPYGQVRSFEPGKPIVVADDQSLDRLDVALPKGAAIAGRISDEHGGPMAGAVVAAMRYRYADGQRRLTPVTEGFWSFLSGAAAITDDMGQYRLHGLSPGDYYVSVGIGPPTIPEGQADDRVGYAPSFYPGTPSLAQAERVTLRVGQDAQSISFAVAPIRFATVSGTVVNSSGQPVLALNINMSGAGASASPIDRAVGSGRPDGTFVVTNVAPGDYVLRISTGPMGQQEVASLPVTVSGKDVTGVTAVLAPGGTARGRVIFEGNPASPPRVVIAAWPATPSDAGASMKIAHQQADGTFEIREIWDRQLFRLPIEDVGAARPDWIHDTSGWFLKSVAVDGKDITDDGYEFKPGQSLTGIEILLSDRPTTLVGTVQDDRGRPIGDYTVIAFATDSGKWGYGTRFVRAARPDQNGKFLIKALPPGVYQVVAVEYLETGEETDPARLENWHTLGTGVTLAEGEARSIALRLSR